jgi:hypothetical protein
MTIIAARREIDATLEAIARRAEVVGGGPAMLAILHQRFGPAAYGSPSGDCDDAQRVNDQIEYAGDLHCRENELDKRGNC